MVRNGTMNQVITTWEGEKNDSWFWSGDVVDWLNSNSCRSNSNMVYNK
jgi:hypothetical protein